MCRRHGRERQPVTGCRFGWHDAVVTHDAECWLLDEMSHAGRENLDPAHVARYDGIMDGDAEEEVKLLEGTGVLTASSTVIDLGAGTGQFTVAVAPRCSRVIAVDVSPVMLHRLQDNIRRRGVANADAVLAGHLTYEHRGAPVDVIYSRYALHHLPDFWKAVALSRMAHMLRPGGVLRLWDAVYNFQPQEWRQRLEAWMNELPVTTADNGWVRADIAEHIRDEHSTFTWLLEPMLERAGFRVAHADYSPSGVFAQYLCTKV